VSPYISVVVPTMRVGGLDILVNGLEQQTYKDFELILADELFDYRPDIFREHHPLLDWVHVAPKPNPFPVSSFCKVANTALANARGQVVLFLVDYTYCPPTLVETHAKFHSEHQTGRHGLMSPHQYLQLRPSWFPRAYGQDGIDQYVDDVRIGRWDSQMWALRYPLEGGWSLNELDPIYKNADPKLSGAPGPIDPTFFHAKNESVPMEALREINGWDEDYDGGHPYQDCDIAERLSQQAGIGWTLDPTNIAYIVNPRPYFPFPRRLRTPADNHAIWATKRAAGYPRVTKGAWSSS